ncbi:unnamed protein product [Arctia plantaginis]|uniref:Uncharacterized protein n=1 Tax=Arctia plantaginis TaxID=874455 RepID=A0A8S0YN54_ARCPL|nr:unnamed protein product [Arctia plantaginis]
MWKSEPAFQKPNNLKNLKCSGDVHKNTKNQNDRKSLSVERLRLTEDKGGLYTSIRMTLFCSRVLGLLPLSGLTCQTSDRLRFNLRSPYSIYFGVSLFGQFLMAFTSCFYLVQHGFSLPNITNTIFNTSSLLSSLALVHMGRFWPLFMKRIEEMEKKLPPFRKSLHNTTANITIFILIVAAGMANSNFSLKVLQNFGY